MNKSLLLIAGLFFVSFTSVTVAQTCAQGADGNQACVSGEAMKCVKKFDSSDKGFKYEMYPVSNMGTIFSSKTPFYKKTVGYTPKSCATSL